MNPRGLDCIELVEPVTDYLECALGEVVRARFEKHPTLCGSCRHKLEHMRLTMQATEDLQAAGVSPEAMEAFRAAFLE